MHIYTYIYMYINVVVLLLSGGALTSADSAGQGPATASLPEPSHGGEHPYPPAGRHLGAAARGPEGTVSHPATEHSLKIEPGPAPTPPEDNSHRLAVHIPHIQANKKLSYIQYIFPIGWPGWCAIIHWIPKSADGFSKLLIND